MTEPIDDKIDVIRTGESYEGDSYDPEVGGIDFLVDETGEYTQENSVFGLEEGSYEMNAVELDRNLRSISQRAHMAPAEEGAVFFADGEFMYVNVENLDYGEGEASVNVSKGSYEEFKAEVEVAVTEEQAQEVSEGFFEKVVNEVEMEESELERQRRAS
ncbi:MAG: hypothetical protein ABEJ36_05060 [Candidatus Nanosalina sp.]